MRVHDAGVDDLLQIGRFARLAGLSVGSLRHYDELDLRRPARIDPATGYRFYRRAQLNLARQIVRLRDLEVPLETIRELLGTDDPVEQRRVLRNTGAVSRRGCSASSGCSTSSVRSLRRTHRP
jgi:DNA-binding transcriptional MerR regulator